MKLNFDIGLITAVEDNMFIVRIPRKVEVIPKIDAKLIYRINNSENALKNYKLQRDLIKKSKINYIQHNIKEKGSICDILF